MAEEEEQSLDQCPGSHDFARHCCQGCVIRTRLGGAILDAGSHPPPNEQRQRAYDPPGQLCQEVSDGIGSPKIQDNDGQAYCSEAGGSHQF